MSAIWRFTERYWSLFIAFMLVVLEVYARGVDFEPVEFQNATRVVWIVCLIYITFMALCLGLIVHSGQMQRRFARNKWRLDFWTHLLLFPALWVIVFGLSVIEVFARNIAIEGGRFGILYWYVGEMKDYLKVIMLLDVALIIFWAIVAGLKNNPGKSSS